MLSSKTFISSIHHISKPQMTTTTLTHQSTDEDKHIYFDLDY
jgi:hypothetical protein